jgi:hypothetical protein
MNGIMVMVVLAMGQHPDIRPGQTGLEVEQKLGKPPVMARQVISLGRILEQWWYPEHKTRVFLDRRRGREPIVTAVRDH